MRGEYTELSCSFCDKGKIKAWHIPSFWQEKRRVTATFGSRRNLKRTQDIWNIQSGCSFCSKTQEEIEKELKKQKII